MEFCKVFATAEAFKNNTTIERITIPHTVETIGDQAFAGCVNLMEANFRHSDGDIVKLGEDVFLGVPTADVSPNSYFKVYYPIDSANFKNSKKTWNGYPAEVGDFLADYNDGIEQSTHVIVADYNTTTDYLIDLSLENEALIKIPADTFIYAYSVNGGVKWKKVVGKATKASKSAAGMTALENTIYKFNKKLPMLLNKGVDLRLYVGQAGQTELDKKAHSALMKELNQGIINHPNQVISFPYINPRPEKPKLVVKWINTQQWLLMEKNSKIVVTTDIEIARADNNKKLELSKVLENAGFYNYPDNINLAVYKEKDKYRTQLEFGVFPEIGGVSMERNVRVKCAVRIAPKAEDSFGSGYTAASKAQRLTVKPQKG